MVQERQQEIVNELLNYMDTLEDGSEVSTWDLMDEVLRIVKESESKDESVEKLQGLIENKNSKI